jgi:hypothetical protein
MGLKRIKKPESRRNFESLIRKIVREELKKLREKA